MIGVSHFKLAKVTKEDKEDVVNFLLSDFLKEEPLSMTLKATPQEAKPFFDQLIGMCLPSDASYVVRGEGDQIVAMLINKIATLHDDGTYDKIDSPKFESKFSTLRDYMEMEILSVHRNLTGRGLAKKLVVASIELAKNRGCAFASTIATNIASQQLFSKLGFETLYTLMHKDYMDNQGRQIFDCGSNPTDCAKLMVKRW
ncbi:putative atp synthase f1 delta subunit [Trichuris trichiura]|uniref:Putative atp synthase f1 delta subunit n=1 Tax=Trichuris trichiura TaxID=36087 RepID=A0A077Z0H7_TRITR|nr:putative atp synthase f1 delta subunit [Trichuris trichiura]